jgi:hypothetical protein
VRGARGRGPIAAWRQLDPGASSLAPPVHAVVKHEMLRAALKASSGDRQTRLVSPEVQIN